eukprot:TRINITY_DN5284_c0_g1_i1.p1 TRINITY_DN5284_c0_g1~~TRINITY_DN5284_c0_g1_i1.p1  ORF type:complete len:440 (+),score=60.32 TRINITY_DN5284_c0_g1_i1:123-1442(+)
MTCGCEGDSMPQLVSVPVQEECNTSGCCSEQMSSSSVVSSASTPRGGEASLGSLGLDMEMPVHGPGLEVDITGEWTLVWAQESGEQPVGRLDVEHSSFGHLAGCWQTSPRSNHKPPACHGWFWGMGGYIQIPLDDCETAQHVQLITLKAVGRGTDEKGGFLAMEGERQGDEDSIFEPIKKMTFEIIVRPKVYKDQAFGDPATRDLLIKVADSSFHVHTAIVATFIPHMRRVLDAGMEEARTKTITCPCDSPHAWRVLLERIYDVTGCFHASAALKVLPILDKYQIPKLWAEAIAELKRLPQNPRPHPHVLDLLCRCEGQQVIEHWFTVEPPDAEELLLFIKECSEKDSTRIVAQKSAETWRRETSDLSIKLSQATTTARTLQHHIDAVRNVITTHAAPAAAWRLQTTVIPDFYINNNLPQPSVHHASADDSPRPQVFTP